MARPNGCKGKVTHPTKTAAVIAMKCMKNAALNTYLCHKCGRWHVGTSIGKATETWMRELSR